MKTIDVELLVDAGLVIGTEEPEEPDTETSYDSNQSEHPSKI